MPKFRVAYEFRLTGSELESLLECLPSGERPLVTSPKDIVAFYLKRYGFYMFPGALKKNDPRVDEITDEPVPTYADTAAADEWYRLHKVSDHGENCPCPQHRPGNPQLSDPGTRGW